MNNILLFLIINKNKILFNKSDDYVYYLFYKVNLNDINITSFY